MLTVANTYSIEDLSLFVIINNTSFSLNLKGAVVTVLSRYGCNHNGRQQQWVVRSFVEQPYGLHSFFFLRVPKILFLFFFSFFLELISPVILHISQEEGGVRITKLRGVKIALRLWDALFSVSIQKGGVRGAEAGNHPEGWGWRGGGTLWNKVQVTF